MVSDIPVDEPSVEWFRRQAIQQTGLEDFGDDYFAESLAAFCADLRAGHLTDLARGLFTRQMINDLARRLQVIDYLKQHPDIRGVKIPPIFYVSGLERTGTTLLHNLLGLDPRARALRRWELMFPVPAPEAATFASDPRIARVQASIDRLRGSRLEQMHWVEATDPEECYWGLLNGYGILGGSLFTVMPSFMAARTAEHTYCALREYRDVIRILLWRNPPPPGGHLVLKAPQFCGTLAALKGALPESRLVITHRDPYRALVSVCNLQAHIHAPFLHTDDLYGPNGPIATPLRGQMPRRLADIGSLEDAGNRLAHVAYPALVADPATVVAQIYEDHGFAMPTALRQAIADFTAAQKAGKRARAAGDFIDFGIDSDAVHADPRVAAYCERYGVQREVTRLTGQ